MSPAILSLSFWLLSLSFGLMSYSPLLLNLFHKIYSIMNMLYADIMGNPNFCMYQLNYFSLNVVLA